MKLEKKQDTFYDWIMEFVKTYKTENLVIIGFRFFVVFQNFKVGNI